MPTVSILNLYFEDFYNFEYDKWLRKTDESRYFSFLRGVESYKRCDKYTMDHCVSKCAEVLNNKRN